MNRLRSWSVSTCASVACLAVAALGAMETRASLVSNWRLDDTGTPAISDVNALYDGTYSDGVTPNQPGRIGTAYAFSGGEVLVDPNGGAAPPAPAPSPLGTVSAWIKPDSGVWTGNIVFNQSPTYIQFRVEDVGGGRRLVYRQDAGHDTVVTTAYGTVTDGVWNHVVATVEPTGIKLFVNGTMSADAGGSNGYVSTDSTLLRIGAGAGANFSGLIDDVAIWDAALSAGKIGTLSSILNVRGGALGYYNAYLMNQLFQVYDTGTPQAVTGNSQTLTWEKFTDGTGTAGTTTFDGEHYYVWFDGTSGVMAVPEPSTITLAGLGGLLVLTVSRTRLRRRRAAA